MKNKTKLFKTSIQGLKSLMVGTLSIYSINACQVNEWITGFLFKALCSSFPFSPHARKLLLQKWNSSLIKDMNFLLYLDEMTTDFDKGSMAKWMLPTWNNLPAAHVFDFWEMGDDSISSEDCWPSQQLPHCASSAYTRGLPSCVPSVLHYNFSR